MAKIAASFQQECSRHPDLILSAMMDAVPDPTIVRDLDYTIVFANAAAERYYGEGLIGSKCHEVQRACSTICEDCPVREVMATLRGVRRKARDPKTGEHFEIDTYPMFDVAGNLCGTIEDARNVTESQEAMEKIRDLLDQVRVQNVALTRWRRTLDRELNIAREIQDALAPQRPLCLRDVCFDFRYEPCGTVGGDLHDILVLDEDRVGVLIADASGHGVGAAFIGVLIKMAFLSGEVDRGSPKSALETVNRRLLEVVPPGQFATAFYGVYDSARRELRFTRAGHPMPMLLRRDAQAAEMLDTDGLVLGALEEIGLEERTVPLLPGDHLLLYTDGLVDATNPGGERYGAQRPEHVLVANRGAGHMEIMELIMRDVRDFADGRPFSDDLTLIVAEATDTSE